MRDAKLYDWSGVLVSIDGFREWLMRENRPLFLEFYDWDEERLVATPKKKPSPELVGLFEEATTKGFYPIRLFPNVEERLSKDKEEGYVRVLFTSVTRTILDQQLQELGIRSHLDEIVTVEDLNLTFGTALAKEDPLLFQYLNDHVRKEGLIPNVYVDDSLRRIEAVVQANLSLNAQGFEGFNRLYLFQPQGKPKEEKGYVTINDIMSVK